MAGDGLQRASTTVTPEQPPPMSRTSTAGDSVFASTGHSTPHSLSSALTKESDADSDRADGGELGLERSIREKQLMLEEARAARREIERRLGELERLREEVGRKVELAGIARKVFGELAADEASGEPSGGISPSEIALYWDSLASDIEGLDLRVKEQLGVGDGEEAPSEGGAAGAGESEGPAGANGTASGTELRSAREVDGTEEEGEEEEEEEERKTPPAMHRAETA
ncbi:hypothetical protein CALCODRAFT_498832 [Calocera cornea HHB12733]|uniref:Uncharacterized protein n=1 Tax=Calocera cornea HHB12733 TaxID=1353952 RepID=A0A165ENV2_9BASI|nr:hypothetical protein CALCODRAFT_498832 [Calocera cornea HHB12733]